jgi:hypothetical protein
MAIEREGEKDIRSDFASAIQEYRALKANEAVPLRSQDAIQEGLQNLKVLNAKFADLCQRASSSLDLLADYPLVARNNPGVTATLYSFDFSVLRIMKVTRPGKTDEYFPTEEQQRNRLLQTFEDQYLAKEF